MDIQSILTAVATLSALGILVAAVLYVVAQKFKVIEDPRIDQVNEHLPGANCGGCGFAGCRNFAENIVTKGTLEGLQCPVGGRTVMDSVSELMGLVGEEIKPLVAVLRCNGSLQNAPRKLRFEGAVSCAFAHSQMAGENGCAYGCLGCGDCVESCRFDALHLDPETGLPVVSDSKCVACGACVKACPRKIIELRPSGMRVFVSCVNKEKGGIARKNCSVACIGCGACVKVCPADAITLENHLAFIDPGKCTLCQACVPVCPTHAIIQLKMEN